MTEDQIQVNQWGQYLSIDLGGCNPDKIRDGEYIKQYLIEVVEVLKMKMFGEPMAIRFALDNPKVAGYSAMCWLETSCITCHFAEDSNTAYIDIFSCANIPQVDTVEFTKKWFEAEKVIDFFRIRYIP